MTTPARPRLAEARERHRRLIEAHGSAAVAEAAARFDVSDYQLNELSAMAHALATAFKRRVLLAALVEHDWCLAATARSLGIADSASVGRFIRETGLGDELRAARRLGKALVGRKRTQRGRRLPLPQPREEPPR